MLSIRVFILCCILFIAAPLSITSIVLSTQTNTCDYTDAMGLDTGDYLLGLGISGLLYLITLGLYLLLIDKPKATVIFIIIGILFSIFNFSWFIVGAVILYRSNIQCINQGSTIVVYGLVMWCLSATQLFTCKIKITTDD